MLVFTLLLFYLYFANSDRFCSKCKHYLINKQSNNILHGKCSLFERHQTEKPLQSQSTNDFIKQKNLIIYLVVGKNQTQPQKEKNYFHCYTARMLDNMCGEEGKYYEEDNCK